MGMQSKKLSKNITASFIKMLLKCCLVLDSKSTLMVTLLIFNIVKKRESIRSMFKIDQSYDITKDPF